jgi:NAD+ synthase
MRAVARAEDLARWMRQQAAAAGARGFVVAWDGGVDSAVVARLAQLATPGAVVCALLLCHSDPKAEVDVLLSAEQLSLPIARVDLSSTFDLLAATLQAARGPTTKAHTGMSDGSPEERLRLDDMKARLRMTALYFLANGLSYLVAGTANRSDLAVGHVTKYGDGGVDLLPLGRLLRSEVQKLARTVGVSAQIIDRPSAAGMRHDVNTEEDMGFTYDDLERYLNGGPQSVAPAVAMRIERRARAGDHKLDVPPMPDA